MGKNFYAARDDCSGGTKKTILMHRVVLDAPFGMEGDHINGNTLDNRRINLRLATSQQNNQNKKHPHKNNKLGVKGVFWHKKRKKYQATIGYNNKMIYLALFELLEDADKAYRDAEVKYFGSFARSERRHII